VSNFNVENRGSGFIRAGHASALINKKVRDSKSKRDIEYGTSGVKNTRTNSINQPVDNLKQTFESEAGSGTISALPITQHFLSIPESIEKVPIYHVGDLSYYGSPISLYNTPNTGQLTLTDNEKANFEVRSVDTKAGDVVVQGRYKHALKFTQDVDERGSQVLLSNGFLSRPQFFKFVDPQRAANDKNTRIGYASDMNTNGSSLFLSKGTFPISFKLGTEIEILKEKSKHVNAVKNLYENRIMVKGRELYMKPNPSGNGLQPNLTSDNMLLASENIFLHTPNFAKKGEIQMLSSGHMKLTSLSNIKLTVGNPDDMKTDDPDFGKIFLGDPFSVNPAVKGQDYTDTIMEILSMVGALTDTLKKLNGKGEAGSAEVSFKHLMTVLDTISSGVSEMKNKVGTEKKDLSTSVFVQ